MVSINFNDTVRVKLTDMGREILAKNHADLLRRAPLVGPYVPKQEDEEGYVGFALWDLMRTFGSYMYLGAVTLPIESDVRFPTATERE